MVIVIIWGISPEIFENTIILIKYSPLTEVNFNGVKYCKLKGVPHSPLPPFIEVHLYGNDQR